MIAKILPRVSGCPTGRKYMPNLREKKCKNIGIKSLMDNNLDPAVLTLPIEVLKDPTSDVMWQMVIFDEDEVVTTS